MIALRGAFGIILLHRGLRSYNQLNTISQLLHIYCSVFVVSSHTLVAGSGRNTGALSPCQTCVPFKLGAMSLAALNWVKTSFLVVTPLVSVLGEVVVQTSPSHKCVLAVGYGKNYLVIFGQCYIALCYGLYQFPLLIKHKHCERWYATYKRRSSLTRCHE